MNLGTRITRLALAVFFSASSCAALFICAALAIDIWYRRQPRFTTLVSFGFLLALVVAAAATLVQWPILRLMRCLRRGIVVSIGAILAVVPLALWVLLLRDSDDPGSLSGYVRLWVRVPGEFLTGFLPMAFAGGMLGWFATQSTQAPYQAPPNSA